MARSVVRDVVKEYKISCESSLKHYLEAERMPYTQNIDEFRAAKQAWLSSHAEIREECGISRASTMTTSESTSTYWTQNHLTDDWMQLFTPGWTRWKETSFSHPYQKELTVMAEVYAYFQVSWEVSLRPWFSKTCSTVDQAQTVQRVSDVVPMMIESKFIQRQVLHSERTLSFLNHFVQRDKRDTGVATVPAHKIDRSDRKTWGDYAQMRLGVCLGRVVERWTRSVNLATIALTFSSCVHITAHTRRYQVTSGIIQSDMRHQGRLRSRKAITSDHEDFWVSGKGAKRVNTSFGRVSEWRRVARWSHVVRLVSHDLKPKARLAIVTPRPWPVPPFLWAHFALWHCFLSAWYYRWLLLLKQEAGIGHRIEWGRGCLRLYYGWDHRAFSLILTSGHCFLLRAIELKVLSPGN